MADLSDLFQAASVTAGSEDTNDYLVISHDFRKIDIPKSKRLAGVTSDEQVNTILFRCDRYYGETDLNDFTFRINYKNANGEGDQFLVEDRAASDDTIIFAWTVGRHACQYAGTIQFVVCAIKSGEGGVVQKEYNTAIHQLEVKQGLETSEEVHESIIDLVEQIRHDVAFVHEMAEHNEDSEAYAVGTRGGEAVDTDDPAYQNSSKWHAEKAGTEADDSEAWANGQRDGVDVPDTDPAYQNNAKWYSDKAADEADDSEAWAKGQRNGIDVLSNDPAYQNNSKWYSDKTLETEAHVKNLMLTGTAVVRNTNATVITVAPEAETRYIYGMLDSLTVTEWPEVGIVDISFSSGSTPTVLNLPANTLFPDWLNIDPNSLFANTSYELSVEDNKAVIIAWTSV